MTDEINFVPIDILRDIDRKLGVGMTEKNTDHIDYKALYEQIAHEYEEYRVKTAKIKLGSITPEMVQYAVKKALSNPYFWIGAAMAMIYMLIISLFEKRRY